LFKDAENILDYIASNDRPLNEQQINIYMQVMGWFHFTGAF